MAGIQPCEEEVFIDKKQLSFHRRYSFRKVKGGGLCICELPIGAKSKPICNKTVEEIWFALSGEGKVWRKFEKEESRTSIHKNTAITIPRGCHYQYKNTGMDVLRFIIVTMPPWPGADEAYRVDGVW